MKQILSALKYLYEKQKYHGNLKNENVLIDT